VVSVVHPIPAADSVADVECRRPFTSITLHIKEVEDGVEFVIGAIGEYISRAGDCRKSRIARISGARETALRVVFHRLVGPVEDEASVGLASRKA
jgi:hypothetical protein